jgi:hypothetical protein
LFRLATGTGARALRSSSDDGSGACRVEAFGEVLADVLAAPSVDVGVAAGAVAGLALWGWAWAGVFVVVGGAARGGAELGAGAGGAAAEGGGGGAAAGGLGAVGGAGGSATTTPHSPTG